MNVLLINHEKPPIGGGGGVFTNLLGKGLAALGQKVYFLTIGARDDIIEEASGYFVITINTNRKNYANIKFDNFLKFLIKFPSAINRIIKDYNIDIVNPHFIHTAGLANYLSGNKLNYIISALGADIYDPTRYKFIRFFMNMLSEKILTDSCYIVLSSQDMYERAAANFPQFKSKLKIIPHCINKDLYVNLDKSESKKKLNLDAEKKIILTVCRLVDRKNLNTALDVIAELIKRGCNIEYLLIGAGPQKNELMQKSKILNIANYIKFLNYISDEQLPLYYSAADVFFLPSYHEAFGIAALEALAAKTPAVCSTNSGWSDFIINYKTGFVCDDFDGYVNKIYELITYKKLWTELSEQAAEYVLEKYDYRNIAKEYLKLYNSVK